MSTIGYGVGTCAQGGIDFHHILLRRGLFEFRNNDNHMKFLSMNKHTAHLFCTYSLKIANLWSVVLVLFVSVHPEMNTR